MHIVNGKNAFQSVAVDSSLHFLFFFFVVFDKYKSKYDNTNCLELSKNWRIEFAGPISQCSRLFPGPFLASIDHGFDDESGFPGGSQPIDGGFHQTGRGVIDADAYRMQRRHLSIALAKQIDSV